jgi:GxxExxY protein
MTQIRNSNFPLKDETDAVIHLAIDVHKNLGFGFLEIVYKDALEYEFKKNGINYSREKKYLIKYKDTVLAHLFYADFVVFDSVILEIKTKQGIAVDDVTQTVNYLKCSNCQVGLILNFGKNKLEIKRVVL